MGIIDTYPVVLMCLASGLGQQLSIISGQNEKNIEESKNHLVSAYQSTTDLITYLIECWIYISLCSLLEYGAIY